MVMVPSCTSPLTPHPYAAPRAAASLDVAASASLEVGVLVTPAPRRNRTEAESPMTTSSNRTWIWAAIVLQGLGYVYDAAWHGLLNPGQEPTTVAAMVRHLATVHLPLYVGALVVLVTTAIAAARHARRFAAGRAPYVALAGALVSTAAEAWHAAAHLQLDTHSAPVAGILSALGYLVVIAAMSLAGRLGKSRAASSPAGS